jgi:hypothetical protein
MLDRLHCIIILILGNFRFYNLLDHFHSFTLFAIAIIVKSFDLFL